MRGSILGPMLVFSMGMGMGMDFVSLPLTALSNVTVHESGAASGLLNATQQVGGSLGLSILVTVFGTASRDAVHTQVPAFLAQATPAERLRFGRTGHLPSPWSDQILTAGVLAAFVMAAVFHMIAGLIAVMVVAVRPADLERLRGGGDRATG